MANPDTGRFDAVEKARISIHLDRNRDKFNGLAMPEIGEKLQQEFGLEIPPKARTLTPILEAAGITPAGQKPRAAIKAITNEDLAFVIGCVIKISGDLFTESGDRKRLEEIRDKL